MPAAKKRPSARKKRSSTRRWLLVFVLLVAVAATAGFLLRGRTDLSTSPVAAATPTSAGPGGEDRDPAPPPTGASASTTENAVHDPRATATAPPTTEPEAPSDAATDQPLPPRGGAADVAVTFADWDAGSRSVQVNAFVGNRVEDGGTCRLTLSRGAQTRTVSGSAFADASTTVCDLLTVPGDGLASGTWQAVVAYSSAGASGTSAPAEVTVP